MLKHITIELPYPPSANSYWRRNGSRYFISAKGTAYRKYVIEHCKIYHGLFTKDERLSMIVDVYPPDRRKRDLGNLDKCLSDSLQHAGVYPDDYQIDELIFRRAKALDGKVIVYLSVIDKIE